MLASDGFLLPRHGLGVQVIWKQPESRSIFSIGGIESLKEAAARNNCKMKTRVITFRELVCDRELSELTGFDIGAEVYYVDRIRYIHGIPAILDTSYFMKSETEGLNKQIASDSIYEYLENTLTLNITTSLRTVAAEKATEKDRRYLDLSDFDFLLVITGQVFHSGGVMFEYTQSRHRPDKVCFVESAVRKKI